MSDYLFARPSFLSGVGRLADLFGEFDEYNDSSSTQEADRRAIMVDWFAVGNDLGAVIARHRQEQEEGQAAAAAIGA